jgi:GNAT superfamily N-acetyltransferase
LIRGATIDDVPTILHFITELARYEKLEHEMIATEADLRATLFAETPQAEVILSFEKEDVPVGFALFFPNYSTFLGKAGIHLEDLFVLPEYRGRGYGKGLLTHLRKIAHQRGAGRLEWNVLDWNTPAIEFYLSIGAKPVSGWTTFRLLGEDLV